MMNMYSVCWILLASPGLSFGQEMLLNYNLTSSVGGNVTFYTKKIPPPPYDLAYWVTNSSLIAYIWGDFFYTAPEYINRTIFNNETLDLEMWDLIKNDTENYTLVLYKYSITETSTDYTESMTVIATNCTLQVFEEVFGARIIGKASALLEGTSSYSVNCDGYGDINTITWMKDNQTLTAGDHIRFSADNRTLTISPVIRNDTGEYQCNISNPVSSDTVKYRMIINYGPVNSRIVGMSNVEEGQPVSLICMTESTPSPSYQWKINGTATNVTTAVYTVDQASVRHSGNYSCTALNSVTKLRSTSSYVLAVKERSMLSAGAIIGIIIGMAFIVFVVAGLIYYFLKKPQSQNTCSSGNTKNEDMETIANETNVPYKNLERNVPKEV